MSCFKFFDKIDFLISSYWFFRGFTLNVNGQRDDLPTETSSPFCILPRVEVEQRTRQSETGSNSNMASVMQAT